MWAVIALCWLFTIYEGGELEGLCEKSYVYASAVVVHSHNVPL